MGKLLSNLQSNIRFPEGHKQLSPYNSLTLLDLRYTDLYFSSLQCEKAKGDLENDAIFDELRVIENNEVADDNGNTTSRRECSNSG